MNLDGTIPKIFNGFYVSLTNNPFAIVTENAIEQVIKQVMGSSIAEFIGSWYSSKTNQFFVDVTAHVSNMQDAILTAQAFGQQAIFDIANMMELYI